MAFFKFRKGGSDHAPLAPASAPESLEAMRKRARHRLIGAAVLVLLGVIGFPLLFDSQPRPIAVDIAIEIPDKHKVKPLVAAAVAPIAPIVTSAPVPALVVAPAVKPEAKPEAKSEAKQETKPAMLPDEMKEVKPAAKPAPLANDAAKAQALLDGHDVDKKPTAAEGRFVVQIAAFSDVLKAREARQKLEKSGLKTYTQVVEPKEGRRIRVRVGPFTTKQEADKVAEKIRKLELPAAVLEL